MLKTDLGMRSNVESMGDMRVSKKKIQCENKRTRGQNLDLNLQLTAQTEAEGMALPMPHAPVLQTCQRLADRLSESLWA